jgi:hypothetical protein
VSLKLKTWGVFPEEYPQAVWYMLFIFFLLSADLTILQYDKSSKGHLQGYGTHTSSLVTNSRSDSAVSFVEKFQTFPVKIESISETQLQQQRRWLSMPVPDSKKVISTAISPVTGWLITATSSDIRLYDLDNQDHTKELSPHTEFSLLREKDEGIRSVAISESLLAVVTHYRLIVYEYREAGRVQDNVLDCVRFGTWIGKSVSIMQVESHGTNQSAAAWVAVGGEGVNGVKLFQYSHISCWNAQRECRTILKCPQSTSAVRDVGFSSFISQNSFVVYGVTNNRIFCWNVRPHKSTSPTIVRSWEVDGGFRQNIVVRDCTQVL